MIRITVEVLEGTLTHQATVTALSIERALKTVEKGQPGRRVRLIFPIEPEAFFVTEVRGRKEAA